MAQIILERIAHQFRWIVKLDGKRVGEIRAFAGKFAYWPKGSTEHGEEFPTLALCLASLEG